MNNTELLLEHINRNPLGYVDTIITTNSTGTDIVKWIKELHDLAKNVADEQKEEKFYIVLEFVHDRVKAIFQLLEFPLLVPTLNQAIALVDSAPCIIVHNVTGEKAALIYEALDPNCILRSINSLNVK